MPLGGWLLWAILSGTLEESWYGARVAELFGFTDLSVQLIERAAGVPEGERQPLIQAFRSFKFEVGSMDRFLTAIDPANRPEAIRLLADSVVQQEQDDQGEARAQGRSATGEPPVPARAAPREALSQEDRSA